MEQTQTVITCLSESVRYGLGPISGYIEGGIMKKRVRRTKSKSSRGRTKSKSSVKRARTKLH
jgi:hypothetical protein